MNNLKGKLRNNFIYNALKKNIKELCKRRRENFVQWKLQNTGKKVFLTTLIFLTFLLAYINCVGCVHYDTSIYAYNVPWLDSLPAERINDNIFHVHKLEDSIVKNVHTILSYLQSQCNSYQNSKDFTEIEKSTLKFTWNLKPYILSDTVFV
jgi:hypothetical protein